MQSEPWPFRANEALEAERLTFRQLRRFHRGVHPGVWVPRGVELSQWEAARAAWLWSNRAGVIAGLSASALLGAKWVEPETPVELVHGNRRPPRGIVVHTDTLLPGELQLLGDLPVTTSPRTAFDLGRRLRLNDAVARVDALMNATDLKVGEIEAVAALHRGVRGLRNLRAALELVDGGAESLYESWTRILLIQSGFPRPVTQIPVHDDGGYPFARIDMGWPEYLVGVDFDGAHHWTNPQQRNWDLERAARIADLGWIHIRLTSGMLHNQPHSFLDRTGRALLSRGCPRTW